MTDQEKRLDPDALIPIRDLVNEAKRLAINAGAEVWADLAETENWLDEAISRGAQPHAS